MNPKLTTIVVFSLVYLFLAISKKYRARALWLGVLVLALLGVYSSGDHPGLWGRAASSAARVFSLINWNVMGIFAGVLLVAEFFILTKVPVLLSDILVDRSHNVGQAMLLVCVLTSFVSVFVENVATVLIIAPLALQISRRLDISPVPFLIGIAIASNLQGTATLVGDPPSMILAGAMGLNFNDFFVYRGRLGIFFAVQVGAVFSFLVLWLFYRKYKQPTIYVEKEKVTSWVPTVLLVVMIAALALVPLLESGGQAAEEEAAAIAEEGGAWPDAGGIHLSAGVVCGIFGVIVFVWAAPTNRRDAWKVIRDYDYRTVAFLMGVFALVGALGLEKVGLIDDIKDMMMSLVGDSRALALVVVIGFSVVLSAFIDNVPYLTAMLPGVLKLSQEWGDGNNPMLAFGLRGGACLGGNITPIGAAANVVAVGVLRREGHLVSFCDFIKIGLPFTIAATLPAGIFLWFVWG